MTPKYKTPRHILLFAWIGVSLLSASCEKDTAISGSTLTLNPTSLEIAAGNAGDTTFATIVVDLTDPESIPKNNVEIIASASVARILNEDGTFADSGTPVTLTTDDSGQAICTVEVPLGVDFQEGIFFRSGAVAAEFTLTVTALE